MERQKSLNVSIIIPAYNEEKSIAKSLESAVHQTVPACEIIVVNNKSTDKTVAIVKQFQKDWPEANIVLMHQDMEQGIIPTRNYGFAHAKGEILGRIDADSIISPRWVEEVQNTFADKHIAAASGPVVYHDMPAKYVGMKADEQIRKALHRVAVESGDHRFLFGSNMAVRSDVWQQIAHEVCQDKEDLLHEDIDIALHLHQRGFYIAFSPKMVGGMSARRLEDSPRKFYSYVMRFERTFKRHGVKSAAARIPIFIYLSTYFPMKLLYGAYNAETGKLSLAKLLKRASEETTVAGPRL